MRERKKKNTNNVIRQYFLFELNRTTRVYIFFFHKINAVVIIRFTTPFAARSFPKCGMRNNGFNGNLVLCKLYISRTRVVIPNPIESFNSSAPEVRFVEMFVQTQFRLISHNRGRDTIKTRFLASWINLLPVFFTRTNYFVLT